MEKQKNIPTLRFPEFYENWERKSLGSVFSNIVRSIPKPTANYTSLGIRSHFKGTFQRIDSDPSKIEMDTLFVVKENDLIVNITFAWEGAVAIATKNDENGLVSHRFPTYINDKNQLLIDFFRYIYPTKEFKSKLELISPGGAGRNRVLKKSDFLKLFLYLPSQAEQQKIASFLTSVDDKLNQLKQKKSLLEQYKKGVMQKFFSQEIRFKDENGNIYPEWEKKKLGDIGETYNGLTGKTKENFGQGKPYIQYKQIFDDSKIDISRFEYVEIGNNEKQNKVSFGDIFFTVSSETPNEIGTASVLLDKVDELYLNSFCFGYRPYSLLILNPYFARYIFRSEQFRSEIVKLAQGSTRYNMSKIQLMKLEIDLPCLAEQTLIANFLSSLDDKINHCQLQIEKTVLYKKGLLQKMFC